MRPVKRSRKPLSSTTPHRPRTRLRRVPAGASRPATARGPPEPSDMSSRAGDIERQSLTRMVHHIPGRLRLRVPAGLAADPLGDAIRDLPGVRSCTWTPRTRSLLVLYEPGTATEESIVSAIEEHGAVVVPPEISDSTSSEPSGSQSVSRNSSEPPTLAGVVMDAFGQIDRRVRHATHGTMGLGEVVPLGLALWAVRELVLG